MKKKIIRISNLSKIYNSDSIETKALQDVNLTVDEGEFVAIMGTSGSGKSTLLHIIGGMDTLTAGEYYYAESAIHDMDGKALQVFRANNISFVFQNFALIKYYSVFENIEMPLLVLGMNKKERKERVYRIMDEIGIRDLAEKKVSHISGGQQGRVAIARAIVSNSSLLLADEPTGALDSKTSEEIMACFEEIHKSGRTIIMVTHDNKVAQHADRIIHIEDGTIVD